MDINWVEIWGRAEIDGDLISLVPENNALPFASALYPATALVRSNIDFAQGEVCAEIRITEGSSRFMIGINAGQGGDVYAGINSMNFAYSFSNFWNNQWVSLSGVGQGGHIAIEKWHKIKLRVQGSNMDLYFNDVKVASAVSSIQKGQVSIWLEGRSRIDVKGVVISPEPVVCFVVMQFTDEYNALYKNVIKPTCEEFGYKVIRADDFYNSGLIIDDITRSIQEAAIIIADVTPDNPNVFYEVGYAHGIRKPTILLSDRKRSSLPFDIHGFRTLFYDNTIAGKDEVQARLVKHLESIQV